MAILIKDQEADRLIRTLAERTGESITDAVKQAVSERLKNLPPSEADIAERKRRLAALIARVKAIPTSDDRTPDEIIGYDERGIFS